ncbi:unnamed protein product [Parascedosporium putredinis]|uniref:Uncharacterized protein n=1 Tax=Parascedosporium putredinis TaxID=1442378 RepID=A0A9P1H3M6_9PEZI|nr:unnamed protein product [Parascedosporium putredinis]CAI7997375.1 unnamed protein product [Parascedosporium putredinis]
MNAITHNVHSEVFAEAVSLDAPCFLPPVLLILSTRGLSRATSGVSDGDELRRPHSGGSEGACPSDFDYLRSMRLTDQVVFARVCIEPVLSTNVDRDHVADIPKHVLDARRTIDLTNCADAAVALCEPIPLHVSPPYPRRKYPEFVFGLATSRDRLRDSAAVLSRWMAGTSAKLVAILTDARPATAEQLGDLERLLLDHDIDAAVLNPTIEGLTTPQNHFAIIRDLLRHADSGTKWFGLIDDDTFSLPFTAWRNISAATITPRTSDVILAECIQRHTKARLTHVDELHQQDMRGDVSGFFESGPNPISLHHWKSWYKHPVDKMALIADYCGDCFLQRWRFGDKAVLTNGYSLVVYPDGTESIDFDKTEDTWGNADGAFDHSLGPFRDKVPDGSKFSHRLVNAEVLPASKTVRQVYVRKGNPWKNELDHVVEILWNFG